MSLFGRDDIGYTDGVREITALTLKLQQAEARLAEAMEDRKRLDWLDSHRSTVEWSKHQFVRDAIDATRAAQP